MCIFAPNQFIMKAIILFGCAVFLLAILSSCGVYKEPCEGVGQIGVVNLTS